MTIDELRAVWGDIEASLMQVNQYLDPPLPMPRMRPPATHTDLGQLERYLGFSLPDSYRNFLSISDGVENFLPQTHLFSSAELVKGRGTGWDIVDEFFPQHQRNVIAGGEFADNFLCLDPTDETQPGEFALVCINVDGTDSRDPSFGECVRKYSETLKKSVRKAQQDRAGLGD